MQWIVKLIRKYQADPDLACAYGIILYRDSDAHVRTVIESNVYCEALNKASGTRWLLIASRATEKNSVRGANAMYVAQRGNLSEAWGASESEERLQLLGTLGLTSESDLPCLLIWSIGADEHAYIHRVRISGRSTDEAFESVRSMVDGIRETIDLLEPRNLKNALGVHEAIGLHLQSDRHWKLVKDALPFVKWLIGKLGRG